MAISEFRHTLTFSARAAPACNTRCCQNAVVTFGRNDDNQSDDRTLRLPCPTGGRSDQSSVRVAIDPGNIHHALNLVNERSSNFENRTNLSIGDPKASVRPKHRPILSVGTLAYQIAIT